MDYGLYIPIYVSKLVQNRINVCPREAMPLRGDGGWEGVASDYHIKTQLVPHLISGQVVVNSYNISHKIKQQ